MWIQNIAFNRIIIQIIWLIMLTNKIVNAQLSVWPASSYSPAFEHFISPASSPVAAVPSAIGAQAPAIPIKTNVLFNKQLLPAYRDIKIFHHPNTPLLYNSAFAPPLLPYRRRQ